MGILSSSEVLAVALAFAVIGLTHYVRGARVNAGRKLPPGPKGIPFFGNLFQIDALRPYPKFREWALQYGPIYRLKLGPQEVIVLNTAEAADELFVNRSKTFSSRSPPHVAHDIMSAGQRQVFLPYDKEWRASRRSLQAAVGPSASKRLRLSQDLESRVLLYDIIQHGVHSLQDMEDGPNGEVPEAHWFSLVRRYTTSIVMTLTYGKRAHKILNNRHLHMIYEVLANFTKVGQPGNYLADVFPILRKLPDFLAKWRADAQKMHQWEMVLWGGLLKELQAELNSGIARDCYVSNYIRKRAEGGHEHAPGCGITEDGWLRDTLLAYTAATVLEAGSDTTASTMQSFLLFMISHPAVVKKIRDEIDSVVGSDRMPTFTDEFKLPYLVACIKETLRRRPATIMGIPHSNDEDDIYEGYFIPKGSTIIGNIWAIHMDPKRYFNPFAFMPERWYEEGKPTRWGSGPDCDRDHYVFGWGRRFCQGTYIAEASLFIVLARIMWGIDFVLPKDKAGKPIVPDISDEKTFSDGFVSTPYIYKLGFRPRSEKHRMIIEQSYEDSQAQWQVLGLKTDER
ncbi:cytochrome P450 [Macrolepiota fuliginosa MF-IS2]|uniref:Cytochrome P450 n=1 Tax=Macrolepiota fuliginosa MF-IS2 TaxID=1400762 RepID=A0A9P5X5C0_9AGAR|nr:cytochrome P450 [Macrolepiota fuliginosa MF-IS2]